jgi:adenylate kinase family enzyme
MAHQKEMYYFPDCKHTVIKVKLSEEEKLKTICPTCDTANICQAHQNAATKRTKEIMSSMNNTAELDFPDDILTTTLKKSLKKSNKQVSEQLSCDEEFIRFANDSIRYRHLELEKVVDNFYIPTKAEKDRVKGGFYPNDFVHNPKQILRSPDDGTIGVATWPTGVNADFAMLDSMSPPLTNNQIKEIGINEMKSSHGVSMQINTTCDCHMGTH